MKLIIITSPVTMAGEVHIISELISSGIFRVHFRRPAWSDDEARIFLSSLSDDCLPHIVLHDHHSLAHEFPIGGLHLNHRHPTPPSDFSGSLSRSCHSFQEVIDHKDECDYLFLSPIFNSISKKGVYSAFSEQDLTNASKAGIIDSKVFALGGISQKKIECLREWSFGGVAILGDFWARTESEKWKTYIDEWKMLLSNTR